MMVYSTLMTHPHTFHQGKSCPPTIAHTHSNVTHTFLEAYISNAFIQGGSINLCFSSPRHHGRRPNRSIRGGASGFNTCVCAVHAISFIYFSQVLSNQHKHENLCVIYGKYIGEGNGMEKKTPKRINTVLFYIFLREPINVEWRMREISTRPFTKQSVSSSHVVPISCRSSVDSARFFASVGT